MLASDTEGLDERQCLRRELLALAGSGGGEAALALAMRLYAFVMTGPALPRLMADLSQDELGEDELEDEPAGDRGGAGLPAVTDRREEGAALPVAAADPDPAPERPAESGPSLDGRLYAILTTVAAEGTAVPRNTDLAEELGETENGIIAAMARLRKAGRIVTEAVGPRRRVRVGDAWTAWSGKAADHQPAPPAPVPVPAAPAEPAEPPTLAEPPAGSPAASLLGLLWTAVRNEDWCPTDAELQDATGLPLLAVQAGLRALQDEQRILQVDQAGRARRVRLRYWLAGGGWRWSDWTDWTGGEAPKAEAA